MFLHATGNIPTREVHTPVASAPRVSPPRRTTRPVPKSLCCRRSRYDALPIKLAWVPKFDVSRRYCIEGTRSALAGKNPQGDDDENSAVGDRSPNPWSARSCCRQWPLRSKPRLKRTLAPPRRVNKTRILPRQTVPPPTTSRVAAIPVLEKALQVKTQAARAATPGRVPRQAERPRAVARGRPEETNAQTEAGLTLELDLTKVALCWLIPMFRGRLPGPCRGRAFSTVLYPSQQRVIHSRAAE